MSNGNYTWESVMLGIDVKNETTAKQRKELDILQKQADESTAMGLWSLGLSILGGMIPGLGPVGYYLGKQIGTYIGDVQYDWETDEVELGKFNRQDVVDFNKLIEKGAKDQNTGQLINAVVDLGKMYVQSGGLTAEAGEWDPTTFGSGESEWTVRGRGTPGGIVDVPERIAGEVGPEGWSELYDVAGYSTQVGASSDFVPSLWNRDVGITGNLLNVGTNLGQAYTQDQSVDYMSDLWRQIQQEKDK